MNLEPFALESPMIATSEIKPYVLGANDAEHDRLLRQAARLEPFTARLFKRLEEELDSTQSYAACIGLIGAWVRKPLN